MLFLLLSQNGNHGIQEKKKKRRDTTENCTKKPSYSLQGEHIVIRDDFGSGI